MTTAERLKTLEAIYEQLDELITPEEMELYPVLTHLEDMIDDLSSVAMEEDRETA
jgi:hypothetical protein